MTTALTYAEFLAVTMDRHVEWVDDQVVELGLVNAAHVLTRAFLSCLLGGFVEDHRLGTILGRPFQMKTGPELPGRAPDLLFVTNARADRVLELYLDDPADLVVEIISPGSGARDRGGKYYEYEQGGLREYWLRTAWLWSRPPVQGLLEEIAAG